MLTLIVAANYSLAAQIHHFEVGKTLTQYNYTNSLGVKNTGLTAQTGNRLGLFLKRKKRILFLECLIRNKMLEAAMERKLSMGNKVFRATEIFAPLNKRLRRVLSVQCFY